MTLSKSIYSIIISTVFVCSYSILSSGCAQIGAPTGGAKDTLAPVLVSANPALLSTNVTSQKIVFTFNEYVDAQDAQKQLLVSPYPVKDAVVGYNLKTVTVKLKDSLLPNTTYSINLGNGIKDVNEGNVYKNFNYVFSTGNHIDSLILQGKVIMAETGKVDSTLLVMLYKNTDDTAVQKLKPTYIAKLNGKGNFMFNNLPEGIFKIYALKDGDGGKTYNSPVEAFAFYNNEINTKQPSPITLYAYEEKKKAKQNTTTQTKATTKEKTFKFHSSVETSNQDLKSDLTITFNRTIKQIDSQKVVLTDTLYNVINDAVVKLDSTKKQLVVASKWRMNEHYKLIINKEAITDSVGNHLPKTDTISFKTKDESDYGNVLLHFVNMDLSKHPILQFVQNDEVVRSIPITSDSWTDKLFYPGEYELRILFDENNNGKWDAGNYLKKLQPEKTILLDKKLAVKANWDNEQDIKL